MRRYVIVGMGAAGVTAAQVIRKQDKGGQITLISEEEQGFYSRPGLAYVLTNEIREEDLFPFSPAEFSRLNLKRCHARVTGIDPQAHRVLLGDGQSLAYDRLLLATGAAAAWPAIPGVNLHGVVKLDSLADTREIIKLSRRARRAVVVGGGITALELVEGLNARRVKTHFFLRRDRYWGNVLDETESRIVETRLQEEGVPIHYRTEIDEILGKRDKVVGVKTKDGKTIKCEIVGVAIGVRPRIELAKAAGLNTDRGVLVDEFFQSSQPDIYAAGDLAQVFDPLTGRSIVDSLWWIARDQANIAGLNMAGVQTPYQRPIPFNVTRLAGLTTTIVGLVGKGVDPDMVGIARGDSETWRHLPDALAVQNNCEVHHVRLLVGDHTMIGTVIMGDQTLSQPLKELITKRVDITPVREKLLAPEAPLADLILDLYTQWKETHAPSKPRIKMGI